VKAKIETALVDAKKDLESGDTDKQKAAMENLQKVGAELYAAAEKAGAAAGAAPEGGPAPEAGASGKKAEKKADVVDADFEVVDEDKNAKK
jgi:molecular chaperone DnaK